MLGDELALLVRQYPSTRNVMLRLLEPLLAPTVLAPDTADHRGPPWVPEPAPAPTAVDREGPPSVQEGAPYVRAAGGSEDPPYVRMAKAHHPATAETACGGVTIVMSDVEVHAAGHSVLRGVNVAIPAGAHVAVVGASGAGKSTLVGLLLGWHAASAGQVLVDGHALDVAAVGALRRITAWVDPAVHLWNRSLLENLQYGNPPDAQHAAGFAVAAADLQGLIEKLPHGLQTALGEGGALVSGGEGQRVRLARALLRPAVRLVILDEPFRGLDRDTRHKLMTFVRQHWREATLVCVSHDIAETQAFDRVLVVDAGAIVEDGDPRELANADSRYRALLTTECDVRERLWSSAVWRHLRIDDGRLLEPLRGVSA